MHSFLCPNNVANRLWGHLDNIDQCGDAYNMFASKQGLIFDQARACEAS